MVTEKNAGYYVLKQHPDSKINDIVDLGSMYIVMIQPLKWDKKDPPVDAMFSVQKSTAKVAEFSPAMDPKRFGDVMRRRNS